MIADRGRVSACRCASFSKAGKYLAKKPEVASKLARKHQQRARLSGKKRRGASFIVDEVPGVSTVTIRLERNLKVVGAVVREVVMWMVGEAGD